MNTRIVTRSGMLIFAASSSALGANLHVPDQFSTIQAAINAARPGDTVLVADGTYTGIGNKDLDFGGKAITVKSAGGPELCIIDCQATPETPARGFKFISGETPASVLDGFTILNGATLPGAIADLFNGAAILCTGSSPTIRHCVLKNNHAGCWGGAICCTNSSPVIDSCVISNNLSDDDGGGIFVWSSSQPIISNTVITNNVTTVTGGGIALFNGTGVVLTNCTVAGNDAFFASGIFTGGAVLKHCIVWGNDAAAGQINGGTASVTYSNIQGGVAGVGNINADPLFVDPANGDFHLETGSPCLDAGDPSFRAPSGVFDMDGHPRVMGLHIDIGADEVHSPDVTGSGSVDGADLGALLTDWGLSPASDPSAADLNADGVVDGADLGLLLFAWTF